MRVMESSAVGLKPGDVIVSVSGQRLSYEDACHMFHTWVVLCPPSVLVPLLWWTDPLGAGVSGG